jgi:hypothetical protein
MKLNRTGLVLGVAALGAAGALALGAGIAQAGTTTWSPAAAASKCDPTGVMHGWANGQQSPMEAAATYLGLSRADLQAQLRSGTSLADVAKARNKPVTGLVDAMVATVTSNLDADTTLTAEQKATALAQARTRIETMVSTTHAPGTGMGGMHGGMWR